MQLINLIPERHNETVLISLTEKTSSGKYVFFVFELVKKKKKKTTAEALLNGGQRRLRAGGAG